MKIYVIPGFKHTPKQKAYQNLRTKLFNNNLESIPYNVSWNRSLMSNWIKNFTNYYNKQSNTGNEIILGFSFGAIIALAATPLVNVKPKQIILCSLVPWFKEDLHLLSKTDIKLIGKKRYEDFKTLSATNLYAEYHNLKTKVLLLYGGTEAKRYPVIQTRIEQTHDNIKLSQIVRLEGVDHDIGDTVYQNAIISNLTNMQANNRTLK